MSPRDGPELLSEVLSRLFLSRGWANTQQRLQIEQAWKQAVGEEVARQTALGTFKRGVLEVIVGSPILLQEINNFHRRAYLDRLTQLLGGPLIKELRLRVGKISAESVQ
jgi:predicted nucleic acid-binding Zn ribbon protein